MCVSYFGRKCVLAVDSVTGVDGESLRRSDGVAVDLSSQLEQLSIQQSTPERSHDPSPLTPERSHDPSHLTPERSHDPSPLTPEGSHDLSHLTPERSHDLSPLTQCEVSFTDGPLSEGCGRSSTDTFYSVCSSSTLSLCDPGEQDQTEEGGEGSKVTYSMIGGLSGQLQVIRETIELPLKHPELFRNYGE